MSRSRGAFPWAWLVPAMLVLPAALLFLPPAGPAGVPASEAFPTGDLALLELYTRLAAGGRQLLGPYSRFHFHHPGPAFFYFSVPFYWLRGESYAGITLAAFFVNVLALVSIVLLVRSVWGAAAQVAAALALCLLIIASGPSWLASSWNPHVATLPAALAFLALAAIAAGRTGALPLAVVAGSFAVQTHLGTAPLLLASGLAAGLCHVPRLRRMAGLPPAPPVSSRSLALAGLLLALLWSPPVIEQLTSQHGNLERIAEFVGRDRPGHPLAEAAAAISQGASHFLIGGWVGRPSREVPAAWCQILTATLILSAGAVYGLARRRRHGPAAALSLMVLLGAGVSLAAATRIAGPILPYLLQWSAVLGVAGCVVLSQGLDKSGWISERHPRLRGVTAVLALAVLGYLTVAHGRLSWTAARMPAGEDTDSALVSRLIEETRKRLPSPPPRRPLLRVVGPVSRPVAVALILALDKLPLHFAVEPFGPFQLGGRWTPNGTEDAVLTVQGKDPAVAALPQVTELSGEGSVYLYLSSSPPPPKPE